MTSPRTFSVLSSGLVPPASRTATAMVARARGTWRWQNAYGISQLALHVCKNGKIVWQTVGAIVRKASEPQLRRMGWTSEVDFVGGMHNQSAV